MGFRGGGVQIDPPPSILWFSSTPAEIGLKHLRSVYCIYKVEISVCLSDPLFMNPWTYLPQILISEVGITTGMFSAWFYNFKLSGLTFIMTNG